MQLFVLWRLNGDEDDELRSPVKPLTKYTADHDTPLTPDLCDRIKYDG